MKTEPATCVICGRPKRCYEIPMRDLKYVRITPFDYTHICRACLERCRDLLADIEAEEARG